MVANASRLNSAFNTSLPGPPSIHNVAGFRISTRKLPILKAGPIEEMTNKLGIAPPEMIFGDNFVLIEHLASGWAIHFDAFGALDRVDKTGEKRLKVAYAKEWHKSREDSHDFKGMGEVRPFDWSYTPQMYRGEEVNTKTEAEAGSTSIGEETNTEPTSAAIAATNARPQSKSKVGSSPNQIRLSASTTPIPLDLLRRPDPILFFDDVILYEDELADNGIAMLSVKIRVMPARLLLLCRFFMRLDGVLIRVRDTRVYVDLEKAEVIREYVEKEKAYDEVKEQLSEQRDDVSAAMRDPNLMAQILPETEKTVESVRLPS